MSRTAHSRPPRAACVHRTTRITVAFAVTLTALAALAGCGSTDSAVTAAAAGLTSTTAAGTASTDGDWTLATGHAGTLRVPAGVEVWLGVQGSRIEGRASCNSYGAAVSRDGARFAVGDIFMTAMSCGDDGRDAFERDYARALDSVTSATVEGDRLTLRGPGTELTYTRPSANPPIEGTTWQLGSVDTKDTGIVPGAGRPAATLRLVGGRVTGSTGCRSFTGAYALTSSRLRTTDLVITPQAGAPADCTRPGAADIDALVVSVLTRGAAVTWDRRSLVLSDGPDARISYDRPDPSPATSPAAPPPSSAAALASAAAAESAATAVQGSR